MSCLSQVWRIETFETVSRVCVLTDVITESCVVFLQVSSQSVFLCWFCPVRNLVRALEDKPDDVTDWTVCVQHVGVLLWCGCNDVSSQITSDETRGLIVQLDRGHAVPLGADSHYLSVTYILMNFRAAARLWEWKLKNRTCQSGPRSSHFTLRGF